MIEFKRRVYEQALNELARFLNADARRAQRAAVPFRTPPPAGLPGKE